MSVKVSLIIPHQDAAEQLEHLCKLIPLWSQYPDEIVIIDSSKIRSEINKEFAKFCDENSISVQLIFRENLFPGTARNLGISSAKNPILAFLDVFTIPPNEWLSSSLNILLTKETQGVWGATYFETRTHTEEVIRAATYGCVPLRTVPGSIVHKEIFQTCGLFLESFRAGEDVDWKSRVDLHKVSMEYPEEILSYVGLFDMTYIGVIKKWHRNYLISSRLPAMKAHRDFYFYAIAFVTFVIAFNWNWVVANWDEGGPFYIPNITKITVASIVSLYFLLRGIGFPVKKGVDWRFLLPFNCIKVGVLSATLDLNKIIAFARSNLIKTKRKSNKLIS